MFSKEAFIDFILKGADQGTAAVAAAAESVVPEGMDGFDVPAPTPAATSATFAERLLIAAGFGYPDHVARATVIRTDDKVAAHLPAQVSYWPKKGTERPYQTLVFDSELTDQQLLAIPAFKAAKISHLEMAEDALARLVSAALDGFQRGGEGVTADVRRGRKDETLCVVSIVDRREGEKVRLICFGTWNAESDGLETFHITEQTRLWDRALAREHLGLLYERQFKKLEGKGWQEAFTTTEEREQAKKLLGVCTRKTPREHDIQESVLDLLDTIAKSFGLKKRPKTERRLQAFDLPTDHDIGMDPDDREKKHGGKNPFRGVTLRDERSRLLGYIVYSLQKKADVDRLHKHLEENNRFHNVLVVYPDEDHASLELWQGRTQLTGKLRKDRGYKDAADVVNLLSRFFVVSKAKVKNPTELAQELAYRARYLRRLAVRQLEEEEEEGPLRNLYDAFKEALVHDQTEEEFADAFAQTITYGLLTARWTGNDQLAAKGERLTRQTALEYLPAASPFLNDLFKSALSVKLDEQRGRLLWLVDDIADLLDRIDVTYVFGAGDKGSDAATDPVIHFYEPFLAAYDKELKNKRGVFFTPRPVVSYIVRSVHELLQSEFGLQDGLASTDTWADVAKRLPDVKLPDGVKPTDPFVCILDPATGTGTFLYECIEVIERTMKDRWCRELGVRDWHAPAVLARWNDYVPKHLLPRLYGFELMMASYAIAHLKLSFKMTETGSASSHRLHVYLTNSLEPAALHGQQRISSLFAALAQEARAVSNVKEHRVFTVVVGNPPYSGVSANNGEWVLGMLDEYYHVDGAPLGERNSKWLQDDYVKFTRLAQETLRRARSGVAGLITNHGYIDNPTFRGMRQSLGTSFSMIRVLDLHGNTKKGETASDGTIDQNVFDIQQGVAILLAVAQQGGKHRVAQCDLFGPRHEKYAYLGRSSCQQTDWRDVVVAAPFYVFVRQDADLRIEYANFFSIKEAMPVNVLGFQTHRDHFAVAMTQAEITARCNDLRDGTLTDADLKARYDLTDNRDWNVKAARKALAADPKWKRNVLACLYRPFDKRWCYFSQVAMDYPRRELIDHVAGRENLCLLLPRQISFLPWRHAAVSTLVAESCTVSNKTKEQNYNFPLYLYPESGGLALQSVRRANISGSHPRLVGGGIARMAA